MQDDSRSPHRHEQVVRRRPRGRTTHAHTRCPRRTALEHHAPWSSAAHEHQRPCSQQQPAPATNTWAHSRALPLTPLGTGPLNFCRRRSFAIPALLSPVSPLGINPTPPSSRAARALRASGNRPGPRSPSAIPRPRHHPASCRSRALVFFRFRLTRPTCATLVVSLSNHGICGRGPSFDKLRTRTSVWVVIPSRTERLKTKAGAQVNALQGCGDLRGPHCAAARSWLSLNSFSRICSSLKSAGQP